MASPLVKQSAEVLREKRRLYYLANRESIIARSRAHYQANKERHANNGRLWREKNPGKLAAQRKNEYERTREKVIERSAEWSRMNKERCVAIKLKNHLKSRFGITVSAYEMMLELQGGRCGICRRFPTTKRLGVDHNHRTGKVRGLLCNSCNSAIGHLREDQDSMARAIEWVRKEGT